VDLLNTIAACSLHADLTLVIAMALTFSHGNPNTVQDTAESLGVAAIGSAQTDDPMRLPVASIVQPPKTRAEAEALLARKSADRTTLVAGLVPVPPAWAALFGRKPKDILNPCINISIATAMLSEFDYECGKQGRACVLQRYAEASGLEFLADDVLEELRAQGAAKAAQDVIDTEEMLTAPVLTGGSEDRDRDWGADRLFFAMPKDTDKPAGSKTRTKN
jgi:hypothetical protein